MTPPEMRSREVRLLVICALVLFCLEIETVSAQQQYNNVSGYTCTGSSRCVSYAFYRTQGSQSTLRSLALLFNTSAAGIANASGIDAANVTSPLADSSSLYIPLSCGCENGVYQAPTSWKIESGDTMYIIANDTFEGLTTYQAIQAANPSVDPGAMTIGDLLKIPLRCACPTTAQRRNGSRILLSYAIYPEETLYLIGNKFNVSVQDLQDANSVTDPSTLLAFSTLLVPLATLTPLNSSNFAPPAAPPTVSSPSPAPFTPGSLISSKDPSKWPLYVGIAVGAVGLALAAMLACVLCVTVRHYRKIINDLDNDPSRSLLKPSAIDIYSSAANGTATSSGFIAGVSEVMGSEKPTKFSYEELLSATNHFSDSNRIQGSVFIGKLNGSFVAIKQMKGNVSNELKILSQVHHGNVVRLVGMCASSSENLYLVYEYAENGSLSDCLHYQMAYPSSSFSRSVGFLSWKLRVQIALDVATGLEYLHNYTNPSLVHKDVKSSNILLDRNFRAKVANFGMAKCAEQDTPGPIMTDHIVGTQGYMAPEYLEHGLVTTKADVFSFGVVLLELLSGREAMAYNTVTGQVTPLSSTIFEVLSGDEQMPKLQAWMDSRFQNAYPRDIAYSVASLAKSCVATDPALRPGMKDCSFALSKMCQASQDWDSSTRYTSATVEAR